MFVFKPHNVPLTKIPKQNIRDPQPSIPSMLRFSSLSIAPDIRSIILKSFLVDLT
jgi:hypothetical protein